MEVPVVSWWLSVAMFLSECDLLEAPSEALLLTEAFSSPNTLHLLHLLQPHPLLGRPGNGDLNLAQGQSKLRHLVDLTVLSIPSSFIQSSRT